MKLAVGGEEFIGSRWQSEHQQCQQTSSKQQ
jgi:hypothetical protein